MRPKRYGLRIVIFGIMNNANWFQEFFLKGIGFEIRLEADGREPTGIGVVLFVDVVLPRVFSLVP